MRSHAEPEEDCTTQLTPPIRPQAPWRVTRVEVLPGFQLRVAFNDGSEGIADLANLVLSENAGVFSALRDEALFQLARVSVGAVTWPGDLDIAPDAMHRAIKECGTWVA